MTDKKVNAFLSDEEWGLVKKHRAEKKQEQEYQCWRLHVLQTAIGFLAYLDKAGMGLSFSEFVNQFGYEQADAKSVYEAIVRIDAEIWR